MKAIVQHTYGTPDVLSLVEVPTPRVGECDVLVEVRASVVTQGDRRLRSGDFPGITWLPGRLAMGITGPRKRTPGTNFAGRVVAVGSQVTRFALGDDVVGAPLHGSYAEEICIAEDNLAHMPTGASYAEAASLPYGGATALSFLRDVAAVQPGEHVCIIGASGGVGRFAVQLAKHFGAEVTGVASADNLELVRSLGADHVVDYQRQDFRHTGARYDVVFDTLGASSLGVVRQAMSPRGRYLTTIASARVLWDMFRTSFGNGQRAHLHVVSDGSRLLETVTGLFESGAIRPVLGAEFRLEQLAAAHAYLERERPAATVVVTVGRELPGASGRPPRPSAGRGLSAGRGPQGSSTRLQTPAKQAAVAASPQRFSPQVAHPSYRQASSELRESLSGTAMQAQVE